MTRRLISSLSGEYVETIGRRLAELLVDADAIAVLMVDTMGQIVAQEGDAGDLDITTLVSLLAASFATTSEMSRQLRETRRTFHLTFHEGERYDIYASNIARGLFLVLIFDKQTYAPKIGMVWLYIKRSIQDLLRIAAETEVGKPKETLTSDFARSLSKELDSLFDRKPPIAQGGKWPEPRMEDLARRRTGDSQEPKEREV
ncbi:MAG TPA: roadblock/LC7 domain-containing protein [Anaerolineae bacterium]|jgi:hypothetical protein|nr:roadblock/LC7 domain-containing protein [Anaerolineae bacterium]